jgi:uncharacterized integral membrane protein
MSAWWLLPAFVLGGVTGVILMASVALGKITDLEAEVGRYRGRIRRLADDCNCACGDGA